MLLEKTSSAMFGVHGDWWRALELCRNFLASVHFAETDLDINVRLLRTAGLIVQTILRTSHSLLLNYPTE